MRFLAALGMTSILLGMTSILFGMTACYARNDKYTVRNDSVLCSDDRFAAGVKMYYVYILTNQSNKVLYTGITNNLERRIYEHKSKLIKGFTSKYNINKLVYYDATTDVNSAIAREKQIKGWNRQKKKDLITDLNPQWKDLSEGWYD